MTPSRVVKIQGQIVSQTYIIEAMFPAESNVLSMISEAEAMKLLRQVEASPDDPDGWNYLESLLQPW